MVIFKEKIICDYCLKEVFVKETKQVYMIETPKKGSMIQKHHYEITPKRICYLCRERLKGKFKYVR